MSDPYTHQGVGRMFPGSLGGRSRVASSVSPVHRQKFVYPSGGLTGPVVSVVATATLSGNPQGHIDWGGGLFAVFTWTDGGSGTGHLYYELWQATGSTLTNVSVTDLGVMAFLSVRLNPGRTAGVVMFSVSGSRFALGITCSSSGATIESGSGGPFGSAANNGWCAFSNTRYFGPRDDGDCIIATKESGSWVWDFVRPAGWAANTRYFFWSMSLSATEFLSTYYHAAAGEPRAAVLTADTSSGRPFTITPGAETTLPLGALSGTFWPNGAEPLGLRLSDRVAYVTDNTDSAVLSANGSVAVSDVRTVSPTWFGYGGRESADRWLAGIGGPGGIADVRYVSGAFGYDSTLVATDFTPYDTFRVAANLFINLNVSTPDFQSVTWPHHT